MNLQYFPGHMHKARRELTALLGKVDVVLELRDARIPLSSANPWFLELCRDKPCLTLLNKSDLADPPITTQWLGSLQQPATRALALSAIRLQAAQRQLVALCQELAPARVQRGFDVRVMVVGAPNLGKSTLINSLAGRSLAKVANEPGVTRTPQRIKLPQAVVLYDTPGLLWPKFSDQRAAQRLAALGIIRDTVFDAYEVAVQVAEHLLAFYAPALAQRYRLTQVPCSPPELLAAIAEQRGCRQRGGTLDTGKSAELLLHDLRAGKLGRISLEMPQPAAPPNTQKPS